MPNWVDNRVTIKGDVREILKLTTQLNQSYSSKHTQFDNNGMVLVDYEATDPILSFYNVIPHPNDSTYYGDGTSDNQGNWYDWNIANWGAKWNASDVGMSWCPDSKVLVYSFNTAWSPVYEIVGKLSKQYPTLEIEYQWIEEQGYGGISSWSNGVKEAEFDWGIPESHADFERLQRTVPDYYGACMCEYTNDDESEYWFDDCPRPAEYKQPDVVKALEGLIELNVLSETAVTNLTEMFLGNNNDNCLAPETLGTTTNGKE